ncbi:MAG: PQQ-dependent sugar dehydrogenase [Nitrososphaeraceae archaeon]
MLWLIHEKFRKSIIIVFAAMTIFVILSTSVVLFHVFPEGVRATDFMKNNKAFENENNSIFSQIEHYLCTDYGDLVHCDPSLSKSEAFEIEGNWTEIYRPSGLPTYVDGKYGKALLLNGTTRDSIEINNTESINPENFSISFWMKRTADQQEPTSSLVSHSSDDKTGGWDFYISENGTISFEITDSSTENNTATSMSTGATTTTAGIRENNTLHEDEFNHIMGTFNGTMGSLFINGQPVERAAYNGLYLADPNAPLKIGSISSSAGSLLWTGIVDDLALFDRALAPGEIERIYESNQSNITESVDGLISRWSFDGNLDDTAPANFGNNATLRTLVSSMAFTPDGRLMFSEKNTGNIRIMERNGKVLDKPFVTVPDYHADIEQGLLGLTIDPHFEKNHYVYLYYTASANHGTGIINRLVRFTDVNNTAENRVTLVDNIPATAGFHSGGAIAFGPDDKLYVGIGDATFSELAQNPTVLLGKVLRIDRDGKIPEDNPIENSPVYTLGHRNIYGIAFDNKSQFGLIAENGDDIYDEINIIAKGGNYGFPAFQPPNISPELANESLSIQPVRSYWRTPAPTQTIYYDGDRYPELKNRFLVGTFDGDIYALRFDTKSKTVLEELWINLGIFPYSAVIAIATSPLTNDIYFAGNAIYKLGSVDPSTEEQTVFPVTFRFTTPDNKISNVEFFSNRDNMTMIEFDLKTSAQNRSQDQAEVKKRDNTLQIEIPKGLLGTVYNTIVTNSYVTDNMQAKEIVTTNGNYTSNQTSNIVEIQYLPSSSYHIKVSSPNRNFD